MKRIATLIIKQWRGDLSYDEQQELAQWGQESPANKALLEQLLNDQSLRNKLADLYEAEEVKDNVWKKIEARTADKAEMPALPVPGITRQKYKYSIAAVTIAALLTTGLYLTFSRPGKPVVSAAVTLADQVQPGGNKAILTLASGRTILLDDAANGVVTKEGSMVVSKTAAGEISYNGVPTNVQQATLTNTLATPKGGQFKIVLPDRTVVVLNAASSITYPTVFSGTERRVRITGEAYFEVQKNASQPFIVDIGSNDREGQVTVLGTHFNINAYDDEDAVRTTLLEGSVKVVSRRNDQSFILKPSQQVSIYESSMSRPMPVEAEEVIAWKNGEFRFRRANIETLLRQAARWYDIQIAYPNGKPTDLFTGGVARDVNLAKFLSILELSEVKCKLEGRKLSVYK